MDDEASPAETVAPARGQVCDEATNRCVEEQNDVSCDDDCGEGERCIDDMCEVDGRCRSDRDCGENAECVENWCVSVEEPEPEPRSVEKTATVRKGWSVDEYFRCIDDRTVGVNDSDCSNEFACIEGMCRPDGPQPCGEGFEPCQFDWMVCDPQLGVCLPPSCANGQRCPEGLMCEEELWCVRRSPSAAGRRVTARTGRCASGRCVDGGGGRLPGGVRTTATVRKIRSVVTVDVLTRPSVRVSQRRRLRRWVAVP